MNLNFQEAEVWEATKQKVFKRINESGLPLVIYGRSALVNFDFLEHITAPVEYVSCSTSDAWGTTWKGFQVISPSSLATKYSHYNVLIPIVNYQEEIVLLLSQLSNPPQEIFSLDLRMDDKHTAAYLMESGDELENIYGQLSDVISQKVYQWMLQYRINRDPAYLERLTISDEHRMYFPEFLGNKQFLQENEVFADVGAYIGDTVTSFLNLVKGKYQSVYAYEPDEENFEKLISATRKNPNITCVQCGIGEKKQTLNFSSKHQGSRQDENGEKVVQIDKLDRLLSGIPVTLIKMDIEGMECSALRGAQKILREHKPKLAICMYHSVSDMLEVPRQILSLNPDYKLYFRQYSHCVGDTVCYAI